MSWRLVVSWRLFLAAIPHKLNQVPIRPRFLCIVYYLRLLCGTRAGSAVHTAKLTHFPHDL
jgi:hypothetical protein